MTEKRKEYKYVTALPEGEEFVGMIMFKDKLIVASTESVYCLQEYGDDPGLKKIQIRVEDDTNGD